MTLAFRIFQVLGIITIAVGAGLIYLPAGLIVGGVLAAVLGEFLAAQPSRGDS